MTRTPSRLLILAAGAALTGCGEDFIALNEGSPSNLTVRAYVDADGNGQFDAVADVPVEGATITATGKSGEESAVTDASGTVSLRLAPGSYELGLTGTPPVGAVLATATNPTVVAPFQGATLAEEYRFTFNPGALSGVVFRDDDDDNAFDPAVDTPAGGLALALFEGGTTTGTALASANTDNGGAFAFEGLRPGTYTLELTPFPTITIEGGNTVTVDVGSEVGTDLLIEFTGSLVIDMVDARAAGDGDRVTLEGIVTFQAPWRRTLEAFIQDGTAGFALFDFGCDFDDPGAGCPEIAPGDLIQISGAKGAFRGEVQLGSISLLEVLDSPGEPAPAPMSGADINAGFRQGELVSVYGTVESVGTPDNFDNHTVRLVDMAGTPFNVSVDSRTGIGSADWTVSSGVAVVGNLGLDNRNTPAARLEPRSPDDLVFASAVTPIGTARGLDGQEVTVEAVVTWEVGFDSRVYFFQDDTGGLTVFDTSVNPTLQRGDRILVTGTVGSFRSEVQLSPTAVRVVGREAVPTPRDVAAADINGGSFQGELVTIVGTVQGLQTFSFDNHLVTLTDGANTEFSVFVDSRTGRGSADWTTGETVRIVGVIGNDDRNTPAARVETRGTGDVIPMGTTITPIATARGLDGQTVTVEGVVTWDVPFDSRIYFFQDATGGVTVFDTNVEPTLAIGDRIRVTGGVSSFRSEVQISPTAAEVIGREAVPFPRGVTAAELNAGQFQGELVTLSGTVQAVQTFSFDNHLVTLQDAGGTDFNVYVDSRSGVASADWTTGVTVQVTGVIGNDDRNTPAARVEIRSPNDIN